MKSLVEQLEQYEAQHSTPANQLAHFIGIPAIIISLLLFLSWFSIVIFARWYISFAWLAVIAVLIYYYFLNVRLALAMSVILLILTLICTWIAFPKPTPFNLILFLILFIGGWILQFLGHAMEKSFPAFFSSLGQLFIAPLFLLIKLINYLKLECYFNLPRPSSSNEEDIHFQ